MPPNTPLHRNIYFSNKIDNVRLVSKKENITQCLPPPPLGLYYKTFAEVIFNKLASDRHFRHSFIFVGKARSLYSEWSSTRVGSSLARKHLTRTEVTCS